MALPCIYTYKGEEYSPAEFRAKLATELYDEVAKPIVGGEPIEIGTKNVITKSLKEQTGLPPIEIPKDRADEESLQAWKNGTRTPNEIVEQLLSSKDIYDKSITPNDESIMREYIRGLENRGRELNKVKIDLDEKAASGDAQAKLDSESVNQQLLNHYDELDRALNASMVGGNIWHKYGMERQLTVDEKGILVNSMDRIKTIYGDKIPEEVKQQMLDIQKKYDELSAKNEKIEQRLADVEAANELLKQAPQKAAREKVQRKSAQEFSQDRKNIILEMKKSLAKAKGQTYLTVPGAPQLIAISPHVAKLVRSFAEEGVVKLADVIDKVHESISDIVEGVTKEQIRDIIAGKYSEKAPTRTDLTKQLASLKSQAALLSKIEGIENGIASAIKKRGESSKEVAELQKKLAETKKESQNKYANLSAIELKKQANAIQSKIDKGEYFKLPQTKRTFENDPEWVKNNREKIKLTNELKNLQIDAFDSQKNKYMKAVDWVNRWGKRVIFFGSNAVYTKLSSAAVLGTFVHRPFEQALGKLNIKLFPSIAERATMEGNINLATEKKLYLEFLNPKKFAKNTWQIAKGGSTELSRELSMFHDNHHVPIVDLFAADSHIMIKDPVKRATFEAAMQYQMDWYADHNIDATHPLILESARQAAYKRAEYEIFQNNSKDASAVSKFFNELEKEGIIQSNLPGIGNIRKGNIKYTKAALYHFLVPVNTVAMNILKRVGLGLKAPSVLVEAMAKNKDLKNGIENMTADEANLIMLQLKKGQIGAAYWTLGFIVAGQAAGGLYTKYYSDKERKKGQPKADELTIKGLDISKNVQHNIQLTSLQMGSTWGMIYNHYIDDKGASQMQAIAAATAGVAGSVIEHIPTAQLGIRIYEATKDEYGGKKFMKDLTQRVGINKAKLVGELMGYNFEEEAIKEKNVEYQQEKEQKLEDKQSLDARIEKHEKEKQSLESRVESLKKDAEKGLAKAKEKLPAAEMKLLRLTKIVEIEKSNKAKENKKKPLRIP
ncbi:MAG: hypothetical protein WCJ62_06530 [Flavobacterium sp.]